MSVLEASGTINLSSVLGFNKIIASNRALFSTTDLVLSTNRFINATFSDAANNTGLGLCLAQQAVVAATTLKDVKCALQQNLGTVTLTIASPCLGTLAAHGLAAGDRISFTTTGALPTGVVAGTAYWVIAAGLTANDFEFSTSSGGSAVNSSGSQSGTHSLWHEKAAKTLTGSVLYNALTLVTTAPLVNATGQFIVKFTWPTPFAVDTTASKWRFEVLQPGTGGVTNNNLKTSDAANPFFEAFSDLAQTFTTNDAISVTGQLTIDQTDTVRGTLGTGEVTRSVAVLTYKNTDPTVANVCNVRWSSGFTGELTIDGCWVISSHSGLQVGTSASRQSGGSIKFLTTTTNGTAFGFNDCEASAATTDDYRKGSLIVYGTRPSVEYSTLFATAATAQATILVTDDVSAAWPSGTTLSIGKANGTGATDATIYTTTGVPTWDGVKSTVTLTSNITSQSRLIGGKVGRLNGYGFKIYGSSSIIQLTHTVRNFSNFVIDGCETPYTSWTLGRTGTVYGLDAAANRSKGYYTHSANYQVTVEAVSATTAVPSFPEDFEISFNNFHKATFGFTNVFTAGVGKLIVTDNRSYICGTGLTFTTNSQVLRNVFTNGLRTNYVLTGANITHQNNYHYGDSAGSTVGTVILSGCINPVSSGNTFNRCVLALLLTTSNIGVSTNDVFGDETTNTLDVEFVSNTYSQFEFASPTTPGGALIVGQTNLVNTALGTHIRISDENDVTNVDKGYLTYGKFARTGFGLADTTVWTGTAFGAASAGQFGLRFEPDDDGVGTSLFKWTQSFPTGSILNKTMQVTCRVKINSATFYAGTHTKPTLRVTYDNGTDITAVASGSTSDQILQVTFTPATAFGQITLTLEMATDASGTNAYVYLGTMVPNLPDGIAVDTTQLSNWANAMPITPSIATIRNPTNVWDELLTTHNSTGTFGATLQDISGADPKDDIT
jgi:hypothetical protein